MQPPSRRRFLTTLGTGASTLLATTATSTAKSNQTGDATWMNTFGGPDYQLQTVTRAHDRSVLLVGRTGSSNQDAVWLATVGPDGEERWSTTVDARGFPRLEDGVLTPDGYLFAGIAGDAGATPWILGTDESGARTWEWFGDAHGGLRHVTRIRDRYAITGFQGEPARSDTSVTGWLRVVDADGTRQLDRTLAARYAGDACRFDGGLAVVGDATETSDAASDVWWAALTDAGDTTRESRFGGVADEAARSVVPVGGGLLLGGLTDSPADVDTRAGLLLRTDGDGNPVWWRTYDLHGVLGLQATRNGFAFTGEPPDTDDGRDPAKPLVLVDRWGRVTHRSTVSVDQGSAVGLARFADGGYALAGWSADGPWVARFDVPAD